MGERFIYFYTFVLTDFDSEHGKKHACVGKKILSSHHLPVSSKHLSSVVPLCALWYEPDLQGIEVPSVCV